MQMPELGQEPCFLSGTVNIEHTPCTCAGCVRNSVYRTATVLYRDMLGDDELATQTVDALREALAAEPHYR